MQRITHGASPAAEPVGNHGVQLAPVHVPPCVPLRRNSLVPFVRHLDRPRSPKCALSPSPLCPEDEAFSFFLQRGELVPFPRTRATQTRCSDSTDVRAGKRLTERPSNKEEPQKETLCLCSWTEIDPHPAPLRGLCPRKDFARTSERAVLCAAARPHRALTPTPRRSTARRTGGRSRRATGVTPRAQPE